MLEKLTGNVNVQKLREILRLEADFNALHKIIFNNRSILSLEATEAMPTEVTGGRRLQTTTQLVLNKKLIASMSNVRKISAVTIHTNAANCYDRVGHFVASLCTQYFRLEILHLAVLFKTIPSMKIFLRTSHRVHNLHYLEEKDQPF